MVGIRLSQPLAAAPRLPPSDILLRHGRAQLAPADIRTNRRADRPPLIGVPSLLLRTTGRKSGQARTAALVYARDGDGYVVVASNGGADRPPGWLFNIEAEPAVEIQVGRGRHPATARIVRSRDAGYPRLWKLVNDKNYGRYNRYQARTARPIALVVITPAR